MEASPRRNRWGHKKEEHHSHQFPHIMGCLLLKLLVYRGLCTDMHLHCCTYASTIQICKLEFPSPHQEMSLRKVFIDERARVWDHRAPLQRWKRLVSVAVCWHLKERSLVICNTNTSASRNPKVSGKPSFWNGRLSKTVISIYLFTCLAHIQFFMFSFRYDLSLHVGLQGQHSWL